MIKGKDPKPHTYFYSLVLELFLSYSASHPIVPRTAAVLHSFLIPVTVVKGKDPNVIQILLLGTGMFLLLFYIYPIVPHTAAFLHRFLFPVTVVKGKDPKRRIDTIKKHHKSQLTASILDLKEKRETNSETKCVRYIFHETKSFIDYPIRNSLKLLKHC